MNERAKGFRKKIKRTIPAVLAASMLVGCNIKDTKATPNIAIEVSDDKFQEILRKYMNNANLRLTNEEEDYMLEHIEEIVENLTNGVDTEILKAVNQSSDNYYNQVDYIRNEELENFIVVTSNEGKELKIEAQNKETEQEIMAQDVIGMLVTDVKALKDMPEILEDSILRREGMRDTLKIAKEINRIFNYGEIQYDKKEGRIEIQPKKKENKGIEKNER